LEEGRLGGGQEDVVLVEAGAGQVWKPGTRVLYAQRSTLSLVRGNDRRQCSVEG
jgi:hypothetical protein